LGEARFTTAGILNTIAGIWVLISPPLHIGLYDDTVGTWNCVIVGITVAVLAVTLASGAYMQAWMSWVQRY